ncbi:MAG: DNA recombination protein RmuC, partial [Patescibacteria group bacterium]
METITFFVIILFIINLVLIYLLFKRGKIELPKQDDTGFKLILQQVNELARTVDVKMGQTARDMGDVVHRQFSESQKLIKEVTQGLTKLDETNRQV